MLPNLQSFFADVPDPRRETRNKPHKLEDIVMIPHCAVLGGYEDWVSIEDSGYTNETYGVERFSGTTQWHTLSRYLEQCDRTD